MPWLHRRRWGSAAALALLLACGESPTEPSVTVEGSWAYTMATELIDDTPEPGDAQCQVASATLTLAHAAATFEGSLDGGVSCALIGTGGPVFDPTVTGGSVNGRIVRFVLGTWEHWGFLRDGEMSGSAVIELVIDGAPKQVAAQWTAIRQ